MSVDSDRFWSIIDRTTAKGGPADQQERALRSALEQLSADDVKAFCNEFDHAIHVAYSWDLWGAAYVIHGGCSDDGFEYFRRWLVSRGRERFERAVRDADSLADVSVEEAVDGVFEFETIFYVAVDVSEAKGASDPRANREMDDMAVQPQGMAFSEEPKALAVRYPRLWMKYGETPLG